MMLTGVLFVVLMAGTVLTTSAVQNSFSDVSENSFAHDFIYDLVDMGVVEGYPDGTFHPDAYINRAEMAKIAVKLAIVSGVLESETATGSRMEFLDVSNEAWYSNYVAVASKAKIFEGYRDSNGKLTGMFRPGGFVSRAEAAKIITLASGAPDMTKPVAPFVDVNPTDWFYTYVNTAYNWKILDGYSISETDTNASGYFGSHDYVTRGQLAKMAVSSQSLMSRYSCCYVPDSSSNLNTNTGSGTSMTGSGNTMTGSGTSFSGASM